MAWRISNIHSTVSFLLAIELLVLLKHLRWRRTKTLKSFRLVLYLRGKRVGTTRCPQADTVLQQEIPPPGLARYPRRCHEMNSSDSPLPHSGKKIFSILGIVEVCERFCSVWKRRYEWMHAVRTTTRPTASAGWMSLTGILRREGTRHLRRRLRRPAAVLS